jgi:CheY-like chemotaxis protein
MILLVDDDLEFLSEAAATLKAGRRLMFARNANQAMALMHALGDSFTLILVALNLPGSDGPELIRKLRADWPEVPIIAIGGVGPPAALESATSLGASRTLRKPITAEWNTAIAEARLRRTGKLE